MQGAHVAELRFQVADSAACAVEVTLQSSHVAELAFEFADAGVGAVEVASE